MDARSQAIPERDGQAQGEASALEHSVGGKEVSEVFSDQRVRLLAIAACGGASSEVARLIREGVDPNAEGLDGVTPLIWAQSCDSLEGMEALLNGGADPNKRFYRSNAVWLAAQNYRVEQLALLLSHGGDASFTARDGKTVLIAAIRRGNRGEGWENFELLLRFGAPVNQVTRAAYLGDAETTAAEDAAALGEFRCVVTLLEHGYNVRLPVLARLIEGHIVNDAPIAPEQVVWRERARVLLRERGVVVEVRPPPPPRY